jgi:hypothetical protein
MQKLIVFSFFLLSDDPFCPVKLFMYMNCGCSKIMVCITLGKPGIGANSGHHFANRIVTKRNIGISITCVLCHKSESSLKTYTGYTAPNIKRKMSETISNTLRPEKQSNTDIEIDKENDIHLINSDLVPLQF